MVVPRYDTGELILEHEFVARYEMTAIVNIVLRLFVLSIACLTLGLVQLGLAFLSTDWVLSAILALRFVACAQWSTASLISIFKI